MSISASSVHSPSSFIRKTERVLISPNVKPHVIPSPSRLCKALLWFYAGIYSVGFFIAYALGPILTRLDKN